MENSISTLYSSLAELSCQCGAQRLVLFGSRARGDNSPRSDIDLAVYDMPANRRSHFWLEAQELPTLLKLDIVHITPTTDADFLHSIEKDGVTLYEKS